MVTEGSSLLCFLDQFSKTVNKWHAGPVMIPCTELNPSEINEVNTFKVIFGYLK